MPPKGFKTITLAVEVVDYWKKYYDDHEKEIQIKYGIGSFAGFLTKLLYEQMQAEKKRNPQ